MAWKYRIIESKSGIALSRSIVADDKGNDELDNLGMTSTSSCSPTVFSGSVVSVLEKTTEETLFSTCLAARGISPLLFPLLLLLFKRRRN